MNLYQRRFETNDGRPADLAHLPAIEIGPIRIVPAMRRIEGPDHRETVVEPLVMTLLYTFARSDGETLSRDDLVTRCWGRRIVGDDAIHRAVSHLRRSLGDIAGDAVRIETIPKVGYRLVVDPAPAGRAEHPVAAQAVAENMRPRRRSSIAIASTGVAAVAAIAVTVMAFRGPDTGIVMAIEPLAGGTADSAPRFAGDLTADIARLAESMTNLTVVEQGSTGDADIVLKLSDLATEPGRDAAISLRLVDRTNGAVVWSREFSGRSAQALRERAALTVTGVIRCGLDRSSGDLGDPVSRRLYLAACDAVNEDDWPRAHSFAQQIAQFRPDSAASWACLALTSVNMDSPDDAARQKNAVEAIRHARRALAIDPESGLAYQAMGAALDIQGKPFITTYEKGLSLDPENSGLLLRYAVALASLGYTRRSTDPALRAWMLEPNSEWKGRAALLNLLSNGEVEEARRVSRRIVRIWPDRPVGRTAETQLLFYSDRPKDALARFEELGPTARPSDQALWQELKWRADPTGFDWNAFDSYAARRSAEDPNVAWAFAFSATRMGDIERAHEWLARAPDDGKWRGWLSLFWHDAAPLRRDPRFFAKMAKIGLVDQWRARGEWPDFCSEPGLTYDCRREAEKFPSRDNT